MSTLTDEHRKFRQHIRSIVTERIRPFAAELDARGEFPRLSYEIFRNEGLLIAALPVESGGMGADARTLCILIEEIARVSPSSALLVFPTSAIIRILAQTGSQEQKRRFFPEFAPGDKLLAFVLTEPDFGSDAASLRTRAVHTGEHFLVNGSKTYVTLGEHAHFYLVFVRTAEKEGSAGISALLIPRESEGLSFGRPMEKMGLGASITQELFLENVKVPADNLLLGPERGWEVLTRHANPMRVWGAASMSLGIAQGAFEEALAFARTRVQFKTKIARFQAVAFMLADMYTRIETTRSFIYQTAAMVDEGQHDHKEVETFVSMAKYHSSDMAIEVAVNAVQILGKEGLRSGCVTERLMRDAKAIQIFDGSNQRQRLIVARNILR
ncbi:MAG: acyl-CoA dehydrogenase family protein [Deltaproteobacteria bacterium]|nr:acyl-CoA dehydrogenase family protein [Deltaproteobacteria bacterium]